MPVPIGPLKFVCPRCHWQRTIYMASDAVIPPEWLRHCPQCGCQQLKQVQPGSLTRIFCSLKEQLLRSKS